MANFVGVVLVVGFQIDFKSTQGWTSRQEQIQEFL